MKLQLLGVNVRQFDDEQDEPQEDFSKYLDGGGLDVESLINDYKQPEEEEPSEEEPEDNSPQEQGQENEEPSQEEPSEEEPSSENEEEPNEEPSNEQEEKPEDKRTPDQAFAELRRKAEQNESYAKWVNDLAQQQGFEDAEQLMEAVNRKKLEQEAQKQGVPVEFYERVQKLEEENRQIKDQEYATNFNAEVNDVKQKHDLGEADIQKVFQFLGEQGYVDHNGRTSIPFEDAYFLANKDTILETTKEKARQEYLEQKEKQQQSATPNIQQQPSDNPRNEQTDYSKEDVFGYLEKHGIPID